MPLNNQQPSDQVDSQNLAHPTPSPNLDQTVAAATLSKAPASSQPPAPAMGSVAKEVAPPINKTINQPESAPIIEVKETEPLPPEVEGWLQKLDQEGDIHLPQSISDDGDLLLSKSPGQNLAPKIVLPLTESGVQAGLKTKVTDSAKWLAHWCLRLIKMMKDEVKYAPETVKEHPPQSGQTS